MGVMGQETNWFLSQPEKKRYSPSSSPGPPLPVFFLTTHVHAIGSYYFILLSFNYLNFT
jgi:hypothetical protein